MEVSISTYIMKAKFLNSAPLSLDFGLLLLRLVIGGLMAHHGWDKLAKVLDGNMAFADPIGIGNYPSLYLTIFAEFVCSLLLVLGLFTRLAVIPIIITMLVAILVVHAADPLQVKELAIIYLGANLALFFTGPGKISIDSRLD